MLVSDSKVLLNRESGVIRCSRWCLGLCLPIARVFWTSCEIIR